mmetsp:Transcript_54032/g.94899  ORF Transcript_54032/g.94899 Transcript_54032/m.94899 type:complete len:240 (+) Transcript_54032:55-774(+)
MFGLRTVGALLLALLVPLLLQGCDPNFFAKLAAYLAGPICVITTEEAYFNTTEAQGQFLECYTDMKGKVENATMCCAVKEIMTAIPAADAKCCNAKAIGDKLVNITNKTEKKAILTQALSLCHNTTANQTRDIGSMMKFYCLEKSKEELQAIPILTNEEALRVFNAVGEAEMQKGKKMAEERAKGIHNTDSTSSLPAGVAAVFLLAGAFTACLAHGIMAFVKHVRVRREKESGYAQLLA